MLDKTEYIAQRIAQKEADFVRKGIAVGKPLCERLQGAFCIQPVIAAAAKK